MDQIERLAVRGAVAQRDERVEGGDGFPSELGGHVLRLVDEQDRTRVRDAGDPGLGKVPKLWLLRLLVNGV